MISIKLDELATRCGEWLRGQGPQSEIVISSRIRLARNLASFPFIRRCSDSDRVAIDKTFREAIGSVPAWKDLAYYNVAELPQIDRQFLVERQLISRELCEAQGARSVFLDAQETYSLMINEEDHLRMQVMHSGLDLESAWDQISQMDDWLADRVSFAFHNRLGYLTACPTNVGTGMRVSVMLHLPALVITQQIEKVFRSLAKMGLAVRGLYGEGSQAMGDFYQISNQITLGRSEEDLIKQVAEVIPVIIDYENQSRAFLIKESRKDLHDRVSRAFGILCTAQTISSEETLHLLSSVRMGIYLGLIKDLEIPTINKLFIHTQPAHLQKLRGVPLETADRNVERAIYLQDHLRRRDNGGAMGQN
ncbi:MAG: protein arginine kinase [Pirellulaceae bacterium]|jgi:protein arginine kinase|nr:protein arginine kinase [Pirellulaceae bacterium]